MLKDDREQDTLLEIVGPILVRGIHLESKRYSTLTGNREMPFYLCTPQAAA